MKYPRYSFTHILIIVLLFASFFSVGELLSWKFNWFDTQPAQASTTQDHVIFIPIAFDKYPISTVFGVQIGKFDRGFDEAMALDVNWLRYNGVIWSAIEPQKGARNWGAMATMDAELAQAAQNGQNIVMIVRSTPDWAQLVSGVYCGPIKPSELQAFGSFMYDTVKRYSELYNVKYWEIWNEPDVPVGEGFERAPFGCWGDKNDDYFGGGYFAEMLKVVYPEIKRADPDAQVAIGGLLLDCDPRTDSNWCAYWHHDERPPKFLEGILRNGGGSYFDGVAFHAYDYFDYTDPELGEYLNAVWGNSWNGILWNGSPTNRIGPVTIVKAEYLREILTRYGVSGKFLMNTEAAIICGASNDPQGGPGCEPYDSSIFEQTKARYVPEAYAAAIRMNLKANTWYDLFGWRNSGLVNLDLSVRPAYTAFAVARQELGNAQFVRMVSNYPGVVIYEFQTSNRVIWLVRSLNSSSQSFTLPSTPNEVIDFKGLSKSISLSFTATVDPHYLIWYP